MTSHSRTGRLIRALPATSVAIACVLVASALIVVRAVSGGISGGAGSAAVPLLVIFALFIVIGLAVDGSANAGARTRWNEELAISATDLERQVSAYYANAGWTAQRDDAEFKVFVRRSSLNVGLLIVLLILGVVPAVLYLAVHALSRAEAVTVAITPTMAGARIEMQGPWSAIQPFYRMLDLDEPELPEADAGKRRQVATGTRHAAG